MGKLFFHLNTTFVQLNMFISPQNKKVLYESIQTANLPLYLKNENFLFRQMASFHQNNDTSKPVMEVNKSFLTTYVKLKETQTRQELQEMKLSVFEDALQMHQNDFENTIALKKPPSVQFTEIKDSVLNETEMEMEFRQKMEEREKMDILLSQQVPGIIETQQMSQMSSVGVETKLLELQKRVSYDVLKKKVSFQDEDPREEPERGDVKLESKLDAIMLEITFLKQELQEMKKMIAVLVQN